MSEERMVRHGVIRRQGAQYELCSADADVTKEIVWVPESLAAQQAEVLSAYRLFQAELWRYLLSTTARGGA